MAKNIFDVTDATFATEVLSADKPVLVDFWAEWCGPCKALTPTLETVAQEQENKVKVCKVDVDQNPKVAAQYGIRSIPAVMLFKGGQKVDQVIGNVPKGTIDQLLKKA
ncbi:MAG: thioredoxin [Deltaproteobacteria bacterium RIFCSPLOWO2_02_FULL_44_10]|nr:MAG: thioredoxin [Deltaproteobacteria bacterium RIFCSPHIGHO2_02_FULL_44_16]OGQ47393.1 MAG: thioredoxin [Deltaproteobacteria bacterium RIFCSPLOWO2_02_FULL_44_10]